VATPDRFLDGFYGEGATEENLSTILRGLAEETSELMCHPGRADEKLVSGSTYARERERELAILCDPQIRILLAEAEIRLITFRDL
jgi:predicted glycoside hydrolase/deacetylase ChbG (UPF0249 family)